LPTIQISPLSLHDALPISPESAVRFLKESGFFDEYIIVGVKRGNGWRRSRCITTFEGRPSDAATILGHLAEYFGKEQQDDKPHEIGKQKSEIQSTFQLLWR